MISERETAVLLRAGFTQREINIQQQKFYNLFRIEPYLNPMRKVGEWVNLTDEEEREIKDRCTTVACVLRAVKAKLKEKNT